MCTGVTSGFAGIKFSGSPSIHGKKKQITINNIIIVKKPNRSFEEK